MFVKRVRVVHFLVIIILLSACSPSQPTEPIASAPLVGPVIPVGEAEVRDLSPTTEAVSNCGSGGGTVIKHPSMSVVTNYAVEWEVGGTTGIGVTIGEGVVPGGVNLSSALEGHYATQFDQGIQQTTAWELPAEPDTVVEYTLMWREVWQPGYVELRLADESIVKANVRYRIGIQSDIVGKRVENCGGEPIATQLYPTVTPQISSTNHNFNICDSISTYPGFLRAEDRIPPGTSMEITVEDGEIHAITAGTIRVAGVSLYGGQDRGSVVVLLPSATYNITELNPTWNWHGAFRLEANGAESLADVLAAQQMIPGTCSDSNGCSIVDVLVVGPNGAISQYEKRGPLNVNCSP